MKKITLRNAALTAGISILVMTVAAIVSTDATINRLVVADDASTTLKNIQDSEMLFRLGVFSWLVILICDVLAAWGLYIYLKPVSKNFSLIAAWFRLIYVAILGAALLNYLYVLQLLNSGSSVLETDQLPLQVLFFLNSFDTTWAIGLVVFGIHVLFLGYLAFKSGYIPKIFGILLIIAFIGYSIINISNLLFPDFEKATAILEWIFIIPMLGEVALGLWLVIKGRSVSP